jgi:integrase
MKTAAALSDRSLTKAVHEACGNGASVHGFRSSFRDWAAEATNYPRELAETALGHTLKDRVERAYQRGDLLAKRARLMADWGEFCGKPMIVGEVVKLHAAG